MKKNPFCQANTHLAKYPHFTEPQGSLRGHKTPPRVPILRQMTAVHTLLLHLFKSHCHNILPSKLVFPSGLHSKNHVSADISSHAFHMSRPTQATFNPLKPELNPICYLLALLGAHHFLHVSRIRVKLLTFRLLMS